MAQDFSWNSSAEQYLDVYKQAQSWKKQQLPELLS